jgi:ubiquinone/menaquinone biosynthesis C-methylase UbiE
MMEANELADATIKRFYRFHAHVYDSTRWTILHGRRRAAAFLDLRPDSQVLDVGCGTGLNFKYVLEYLDPARGGLLTGVDFSAAMLRQAAKRVARRGWTNVELIEADATKMDLGRKFDAAFFGYSLAVIPDWEASLLRVREHLVPGGTVVILDFDHFDHWGPLAPIFRGWLRLNHVETLRPYAEGVRRHFQRVEIHSWLGRYNFTAVGRKGG